jgi:hypothetical protein
MSTSAYAIAQCAEQLVWLVAAIQPRKAIGKCRPCLNEEGKLDFFINATLEEDEEIHSAQLSETLGLFYERVGASCAVQGFPTRRRPGGFVGLEVSWYTLLEITQWPTVDLVHDCAYWSRCLRGQSTPLELMKIADNISLWHICRAPSTSCGCSNRYLSAAQQQSDSFGRVWKALNLPQSCDSLVLRCPVPWTSLFRDILPGGCPQ